MISAEHTLTQLGKLWFEFFPPSRCACSRCRCGVVDDIYTERQQNGWKRKKGEERENFITSNFTFIFRPSILVIKKLSLFLKDAKSFLMCRADSHWRWSGDEKFEVFWNFNWPHFQCTLWHSREKLFRCSSHSSVSYMKFSYKFGWKCWVKIKSLMLTTLSNFRQNFCSPLTFFERQKICSSIFHPPHSHPVHVYLAPPHSVATSSASHHSLFSLSLCLSTLATSGNNNDTAAAASAKPSQNTIVESGENRVGMKMREKSSMMWGRTGRRVRNGKAARRRRKISEMKAGMAARGGEKSFNSHSSPRASHSHFIAQPLLLLMSTLAEHSCGNWKKRRWLSRRCVFAMFIRHNFLLLWASLPKRWRRKEATPTQLCKEFSLFSSRCSSSCFHADFFPSPTQFLRPLSPPSKHPCARSLSLEKALREVLKSFLLRSFSRWNDSQADDV